MKAYQTAVEQLVDYAAGQKACRITAVAFDMLDNNLISAFLDDMEQHGCSVSTRNHKLKSIRALFAYALLLDNYTPSASQGRRVSFVPLNWRIYRNTLKNF